jgi:hypothetical protein
MGDIQGHRMFFTVSEMPLAAAAHARSAASRGDPESGQMLISVAEALAGTRPEDAGTGVRFPALTQD